MLGIGVALIGVQLAVAGRYGWHRDELYFVACSHHLAWGYVDQPPFTPLVARLATALFGSSLYGLRLFPALADAAMTVLAGVIARDLGGRHRAQTLSAVAVASGTVLLAVGHLLSTAVFDFTAWTARSAVVIHILRTGNGRWWVVAGAIAGIGLENKHSVAFLLGALLVGILLSKRAVLRDRWLWLGGAIAVVLWLPNLAWQATHGWPVFEMSSSLHANGVHDGNPFVFLPMQLVFLGPLVGALWIAGLVWLLRGSERRECRALAVAWLVLAVGFVVTAGKPYYLAGMYPALIAAGAVWLEDRASPATMSRSIAAVAIAGVLTVPLGLPVLPPSATGSGVIGAMNPELRETYGWEGFVRTVEDVPGSIVFTQSYGEAGALQQYRAGRPVYSGHNSYWLWGPPPDSPEPVVVVGHFTASYLAAHFVACDQRATIENSDAVPNKERGAHVWTCAGPARPWSQEWASLRHYDA